MKCHTCGGQMYSIKTDLPFKLDKHRILVVKNLPVEQCASCGEYLIIDSVMEGLDRLIENTDQVAELEVRSYAA